ncbi:MAG: AAA family ATPase [Alphaproteobacteria bacterium]|nr:AAA family ATPase [Alphaproteobacteria bacterium]
MITSLRLIDFKNFADETLRLGPFTVLVGANASGKSNIRDAFRLLHGIGCGYSLGEIFGGKYSSGHLLWAPLRGAPNEILRHGQNVFRIVLDYETQESDIQFDVSVSKDNRSDSYEISSEAISIDGEFMYDFPSDEMGILEDLFTEFFVRNQLIFSHWDQFKNSKNGKNITSAFSNMRFLDPVPELIRQPSFPGQEVLGDHGENLPAVVKYLYEDETLRKTLVEWIRELTPMDISDFEFPTDPAGRIHLILKERDGRRVSSFAASDGTLRFVTIIAALLIPNPPSLYFFEEIDNGIHPSRLRLLVDLIETRTAKGQTQVVATTHSPELLSIMNDETFKHTSVVSRQEGDAEAIIRQVCKIPNATELRKSQGLGRLLAGGWMENALAFTEDDADGEETPG